MGMSNMPDPNRRRFKDCLQSIDIRLMIPRVPADPHFLPAAVREIKDKLRGIDGPPPPPYELNTTWHIVRDGWRQRGNFDDIPPVHLRRMGWVLFYPENSPTGWLGLNEAIVRAFLAWLRLVPRGRVLSATLHEFLRVYPADSQVLPIWRDGLRELLESFPSRSTRIQRWRDHCSNIYCFRQDGCEKYAMKLLVHQDPVDKILEESGFTGTLAASGYLRSVQGILLHILSGALSGMNKDVPSIAARIFQFVSPDGKNFRFPETRVSVANDLLLPFEQSNPSETGRDLVREFLLGVLGHPQINQGRWQGVDRRAQEVMLRWLASVALETFFMLLDRTALDRHWRHRRKLWSAYHHNGYIRDAWLVLGGQAAIAARQLENRQQLAFAKFVPGGQVQATHSVLLFRIGDLVVAEWSHSGKCRIWLPGNPSCPRLYQAKYSRRQLVNGSDYEQVHQGAEEGRWQQQIHYWISQRTGIKIPLDEYMPQRQRYFRR